MKTLLRIAAVAALVLVVGGGVYLAFSERPAPTAQVQKTIPNDRFER